MDWEAAGVITATTMSALALGVSAWGLRQTDKRARDADGHAREAAGTAERAAQAAERMATALERHAIDAERRAPVPGVVWTLENDHASEFFLTNAGRASAHDVRVELADHLVGDDLPEKLTVKPGGVVKFRAGSPDRSTGPGRPREQPLDRSEDLMTVTWTDGVGPRPPSSWTRSLPPRRFTGQRGGRVQYRSSE